MPEFFEYLRNIPYYLVFATVAGMFAPAGNYRKFVSLTLGFILLLLMIQPLAGFFRENDIPITNWFVGNFSGIQSQTDDPAIYSDWWDEYFLSSFEAQLNSQITRLLSGNGFAVHSSEFSFSNEYELTAVRVSVSREENSARSAARVPLIRIEPPQISPIRIGNSQNADTIDECPDIISVKNIISEFYNLPKSHIHVNVI
ncbi:MAG: stage III sporulation protein AF [Clostridiales bacterium]|jgi:hypothetical protein|nr:stage III sporulation protein AF [Clostridiales bacterium]